MTQEELDAIMRNDHYFSTQEEFDTASHMGTSNLNEDRLSSNPLQDLSNTFHAHEQALNDIISVIGANISLFQTLTLKFPHIEAFKTHLERNCDARENLGSLSSFFSASQEKLTRNLQTVGEEEKAHHKLEQVVHLMQGFSSYAEFLLNDQAEVDNRNIQTLLSLFGRK
jgi:hypothetical protein